jgi:LacI family transcriptional regulator
MDGYKKALEENRIKPFIKRLKYNEDPEKTVQQIVRFLKEKPEIDAIFFATNYLGISGLEALNRLNYKIPSDVGVVSFDDHDLFRLYTPSITVVAQPVEEMSKKIINILLDELNRNDKLSKVQQITLPATLIIRNSSKKKQV